MEARREHAVGVPNLVSWSSAYSIGLYDIDNQHQELFDLINRLWASAVRRPDVGEVERIIQELERYTIAHFTAEEAFMRVSGYPELPPHKQAHDAFVQRIAQARADLKIGRVPSLELLHYLKDWLINHILVSDVAYATHYRSANLQAKVPTRGFFARWFAR